MDAPARLVSGLTPAAKALFVAAAAHAQPNGVVLYVVPGDADLEETCADVTFFLAALEGFAASAAERAVLPFPSHEVDPYRGLAPHIGVTSVRARALYSIAQGTARVVIASAAAVLPRVTTPERMLGAAVSLKPGQDISPLELAELLVDAGFTREDPADEHGEFAIRGGIADVFPAGEAHPMRLEFIGDTIETLRTYDPSTQRSIVPIDQMAIVPLRDVLDDNRGATIFDYLSRAGAARIIVSERDEVDANATKLLEQINQSYRDIVDNLTGADARGHAAAEEYDEDGVPRAVRRDRARARAADAPLPDEILVDWDTVAARLANATELSILGLDGAQREIRSQPAVELKGRVADWVAEIRRLRDDGESILFVAATPGRAERTIELLKEYDVFALPVERAEDARYAAVLVAVGALSRGFRLPDAGLQIYAEPDVFEEERRAPERRRSAAKAFLSDLRDLKVGDYVVHVDNGIGMFVGLKQLGVGDSMQEFLELRYAGEDKLFVPVERLDLVQKYTGASKPPIDRLGGTSWEKAKSKVKKAMRDMAEELLKLYAARKAVPGHSFAPDSHWQQEFEDAFEYDLTIDQTSAVTDIKKDMESATPMDRLLCGDVGYGKTEVAVRAAFKAVMDGKQVAVLAPTTVLAFEHAKTLRDRFAGFPVTIDVVNRFRTKQETKEILDGATAGKGDILVGTHPLLSKDVAFKDLGLLVVDEEQRFGVAHKERIKQMRKKVDVLTMTATPIPRTLNMSLVGIRDMSIIETPPKDRLSIQTNVVKFDAPVIERAVKNELARGGQVYFVHNRVESIFSIGSLLQRLVPEARVAIGHGQMGEEELERAMLGFVERRFDILLATTIVENGLDIPNANTMIINRADRYGLSQLYQLRGRVGRSDRAAYAYLLIPPQETLSPVAKKRLAAIKEFSDLGSGFRVAALDLEIRGAGNLLGGEQSGHIDAVGFEMYMKLLEEMVRELKGEEIEDDLRATVNLRVDLKIDGEFIPDMNQRLMVYRKIAAARSDRELQAAIEEVRDRYGAPPPSVLNLAEYGRIRIMADRLGVDTIDREGRLVVVKFRPTAKLDPVRLVKVVSEFPGATLVPPVSLKVDLEAPLEASTATRGLSASPGGPDTGRPTTSSRPVHPSTPWTKTPDGRLKHVPSSSQPVSRLPPGARGPEGRGDRGQSWWTARATAGEVTAGFTKNDILRKPEADPRAEGGMFARLEGLLQALS